MLTIYNIVVIISPTINPTSNVTTSVQYMGWLLHLVLLVLLLLLLLLLHLFNGLFSRTTWVSQYQKGKNHFGFKGGKRRCGFGMQWHQLDHMQTICTLLQTTPTRHHSQFLQTRCSSWCPTNSVKTLKADIITRTAYWKVKKEFIIVIHFYTVSFQYKPAIQRSVMYSVTDSVSLLY